MLLKQKNLKSIVFLFSFSLLFSTLPAVGMIPILIYLTIDRYVKLYDKNSPLKKNIFSFAKEIFTFQNLFAGGIIGLTSFWFLKLNISGGSISLVSDTSNVKNFIGFILHYVLFILLEFLVYYIVIFKKHSKNPLYYVSLAMLLIAPLIRVGSAGDFSMRASIPSLIVLFILVIDTLTDYIKNKKRIGTIIICGLLIIGSFTALHEIARTVSITMKSFSDPSISLTGDPVNILDGGNNFLGKFEDSFFFKYIAKK